MNDVNDDCLATGEGTNERISKFQGGIEPMTSGHWSGDLTIGLQETPGELGRLTGYYVHVM